MARCRRCQDHTNMCICDPELRKERTEYVLIHWLDHDTSRMLGVVKGQIAAKEFMREFMQVNPKVHYTFITANCIGDDVQINGDGSEYRFREFVPREV